MEGYPPPFADPKNSKNTFWFFKKFEVFSHKTHSNPVKKRFFKGVKKVLSTVVECFREITPREITEGG